MARGKPRMTRGKPRTNHPNVGVAEENISIIVVATNLEHLTPVPIDEPD